MSTDIPTRIDDEQSDWLVDDSATSAPPQPTMPPWKLLIVDDEPDVHAVTRLAVRGIEYKGRGIELLSAYSGQQGFEMLRDHRDIALVLLDVVMEREDAGLRLVERVRQELGNSLVRIVLRTGQPGQAPEQEVIVSYDINDYKAKTELTVQKLFTTIISSLRAYESLVIIERSRQGLNRILEGSANLYKLHNLREFASGVLGQISAILDVGTHGVLCVREFGGATPSVLQVLGATGIFSDLAQTDCLDEAHPLHEAMWRAINEKRSVYDHPNEVLYFPTHANRELVVYFTPPWPLSEVDRDLLEVFCHRISAAFDNLYYHAQMQRAQEATVVALADLAEYRDTTTGEHVLRVQRLTSRIAQRMAERGDYPDQLTPRFLELVGTASILHDVGKVGTPDNVLFHPGQHDPRETEIMHQHATIGAAILTRAANMVEGVSYLSLGAEIAGGHHEYYDGAGYPAGSKGEQIPLSARIVSVVDVFDALMHKRPYKEPWPLLDSVAYIRDRAGKQFDPKVVAAFMDVITEEHPELASAPAKAPARP